MDSTTSPTQSKPTVVFVGSNPAEASQTDGAFHGSTKSSHILERWTAELKAVKMHINVMAAKTKNNRPLKRSEIKASLPSLKQDLDAIKPDYVIALGKTAATALTLLGLSFYEMPHPSGRNRLLNDKTYESQKVKGLLEHCSRRPIT